MLWFIQVSVASLVIIFVLHNLYSFFKETLTVPKIKDMVKRPQQKYETLFRELHDQVHTNATAKATNDANANEMKNELKRYLMDLNSSTQSTQSTQQPTHPQPQSDFIEFGSTFQ
jgi:hypothetical protein